MAKVLRAYWDACAWLGLLNGEERKRRELEIVWGGAGEGKTEIWTSTLSLAEVFKKKCEASDPKPLSRKHDEEIETLFRASHVKRVQVDTPIGTDARRLLREHPELRKANDAIHLATALRWNCDVLHTYDRENLIALNGKLQRRDGEVLRIGYPDEDTDGPLFGGRRPVRAETMLQLPAPPGD